MVQVLIDLSKLKSDCNDMPILAVSGSSEEKLAVALALAEHTATGYINENNKRLVLFHTHHTKSIPLPGKYEIKDMVSLVTAWLRTADYPEEPDHDGDNSKGWVVGRGDWGHVSPYGYEAFVSIEPYWMAHGK